MSDELIPAPAQRPSAPATRPAFEGFEGAAMAPFPDDARKVLAEPVDPRDVEIRTDGIVYLSGVWYRRQLTRAFGAGAWAVVPRSPPQKMGEMVTYHGALIVLGRYVSEATGECETRAKMTYASSLEGARTDCITRCCKDLGMASELWDPSWRKAWTRDCAYQKKDGKWYKNDGSEHDMTPLYVARAKEEAEAREAYRATVRESAGPKAPGPVVPKTSAATTTPAATAATNSAAAPTPPTGTTKSYLPANKVIAKQGDPMSVAGQWQRLGVLRGEIGWVDWPKDDEHWDWNIGRWPMYRQNLGRYWTWDGKRCQSAKDLTFDQAANLIKRMGEQHARNGIRHARMEDETAANLGALGGGGDHFGQPNLGHEEPDLGLIDSTFEASEPAGRGPSGERAPTGAAPESPVNSHDGPGQGPKAPPPKDYVMCSPELRDEIVELVVTKQLTQQWAKDAVNKWFGVAYGSLLADMVGRLTQTQAMTYLELVMAANTPAYRELLAASRAAGRIR